MGSICYDAPTKNIPSPFFEVRHEATRPNGLHGVMKTGWLSCRSISPGRKRPMEVDPDHVTTRVRRQRREQFYSRHPTRRPAALLEGDTPIIEVKIVIPTSTALSHQEVLLRRQNAGVSVVPVSSSTEGQLRRRVVARTLERTRIYTRTLARTREATCLVRVRYGVVGGGGLSHPRSQPTHPRPPTIPVMSLLVTRLVPPSLSPGPRAESSSLRLISQWARPPPSSPPSA